MLYIFIMLFSSYAYSAEYQVNKDIKLIDLFSDSNKKLIELEVEPIKTKPGDMLVLVQAVKHGKVSIPHSFEELVRVKARTTILSLSAKFWEKGEPFVYPLKNKAKSLFASLLTFRGPVVFVDAIGAINTARSLRGLAYAPRAEAIAGGAVVTAFAYGDPHKVNVKGAKTLVSEKDHSMGYAIGLAETKHDIKIAKTKAYSGRYQKGSGEDLAFTVTIY